MDKRNGKDLQSITGFNFYIQESTQVTAYFKVSQLMKRTFGSNVLRIFRHLGLGQQRSKSLLLASQPHP